MNPTPFADDDPVMLNVLDYFEQDIMKHSEKIVPLPESLISRLIAATEGVPLPSPEDNFEMDEIEAAEHAEIAAEVKAEMRQSESIEIKDPKIKGQAFWSAAMVGVEQLDRGRVGDRSIDNIFNAALKKVQADKE